MKTFPAHSAATATAAERPQSPALVGVHPRVVTTLAKFAGAANLAVFIVPTLVLLGWLFGLETLKRVLPGLVAMNPATAVNFLLLAFALAAMRGRPRFATLRIFACVFVGAFGLVILSRYLFGFDPGIDRMLFRSALGQNQMAPNTALNFVLLSGALLLFHTKTDRGHRPAEWLALVTALIALLALIGYGFGVGKLYGIGAYIPIALHTAVCFLLLAVATLCARADQGMMARVSSDGAGGSMVRRLLPWLILVPLAGGWLILAGHRSGRFDAAFGFTLFVVLVIVFVALMLWKNAGSLDQNDAERNRAEDSLRQARDELELRVEQRVGELASVMTEVRDAVKLLGQAGRGIVQSATALAASATQTASAVSQTSVTAEQLRKTVELSSDKASAVAEGAREAAQISERGLRSKLAADEAMTHIREGMELLAERTCRLGEQTKSIGEMIATVDDLAQQSNVLSINAAIEAASAGEHGRGFAAVAREVKALAEQSRHATTQVRQILQEIGKANVAAMNATKDGRTAVEAGMDESARTGESIEQLAAQVSKNAEAAAQISASSREQSIAMDQVAEAMVSVKEASNHNVDTARELEASAKNLQALGARLTELIGRYRA